MPYLWIRNDFNDETGIDRFPMPEGTLTPIFSGLHSTTFSGFRIDFVTDISAGVTGFSELLNSRRKNLGLKKTQRKQTRYKPRRTAAKSGVEVLPNGCENAS